MQFPLLPEDSEQRLSMFYLLLKICARKFFAGAFCRF